jgi:outer membrane immunogenic protein
MLKSFIFAALSLALLSPASAADLPVKARPMAPLLVTESWAGFYIGIHGGAAWSREDLGAVGLTTFAIGDLKPSGSVLGAQAGYMWQYVNVAAGFEIDYSHLGFSDSKAVTVGGEVITGLNASVHVRDLASARARVGLVVMPSILAFVTAGPAWGNADAALTAGATTVAGTSSAWGWSAGGGLEWRMFSSLSLRGEYLHYDLGKANFSIPGVTSSPGSFKVDVARAALSWHFN